MLSRQGVDWGMEKWVTLRFYDIAKTKASKPAFADILNKIAKIKIDKRGRTISADLIYVRLENFKVDGDFIEGQFVRGQSGNRPGVVTSNGTSDLPFSDPIGHGIAFRYRTTDGLLGIEFNPLVLSPSKALTYIYEFDATAEFRMIPRLREGVWEELEARPLRKLVLGVAGHPNPRGAESDENATWSNLSSIRDRYDAHTIRIELGMGNKKGSLAASAKSLIEDAFSRHETGVDDIRTLRGTLETSEGIPNDEINLISELLDVREELSFPGNNWKKFYSLRRDLLKTRLDIL